MAGSGSRTTLISRRMSAAVAVVIIAFIVLPPPKMVVHLFVHIQVDDIRWYIDLYRISGIALVLNSAIIPAIYGICAKPFRDRIRRAVTCK
jgi:hypothetical protein